MAKLVASEAGGRVVDRAMQIHGGYGMTKDLPSSAGTARCASAASARARARCSASSWPATCSAARSTETCSALRVELALGVHSPKRLT